MRLEIRHVLHAGLDSLRHEQGFLARLLQLVEDLAHAATLPVKAQREADPAL